jgi:hypothetical protein
MEQGLAEIYDFDAHKRQRSDGFEVLLSNVHYL